jgi:Na+/proline symporter
LVTVITILYCTVGGIVAVIWSDVIQSFVIIGGTVFIRDLLISGTDGGIAGFIEIGQHAENSECWTLRWISGAGFLGCFRRGL